VAQVRYVPGRSVTVQYTSSVSWPDGSTTAETLVASSGLEVAGPAALIEADGTEIAVWRFPNDPFLPGLAAASDPERVKQLLADLGAPADTVRLRRRAYRAGRRAVIEARTPSARVYLKVLRPRRAEAVHAIHARLSGDVPVPRSHGWSKDLGIIVLETLDGEPMRSNVENARRPLPSAAELGELLDRFPPPNGDEAIASDPLGRVHEHSEFLGFVVPDLRVRLGELAARIGTAASEPVDLVHGDFHSSQILLEGGAISGLVDIDTVGRGDRATDYAALLAHLSVLVLSAPRATEIDRYGRELIAGFDQIVDPAGLRMRVAASVLGLATGPFRVQELDWPTRTADRVRLAERWAQLSEDQTAGQFPTCRGHRQAD
jgi:tRNA A-37 threonylcarbamoyl transferase component Bud32